MMNFEIFNNVEYCIQNNLKHDLNLICEKYNTAVVFTDGSFAWNNHNDIFCGYAYHVLSSSNPKLINFNQRLIGNNLDNMVAEALAIYYVLLKAIEQKLDNIIIYTDCKSLLQSIINRRKTGKPTLYQNILEAIIEIEEQSLISSFYCFVPSHGKSNYYLPSVCNNIADKLAKDATRFPLNTSLYSDNIKYYLQENREYLHNCIVNA